VRGSVVEWLSGKETNLTILGELYNPDAAKKVSFYSYKILG
jgi:hypothetical protein